MRVYFSHTNFDFPKRINDLRLAWFNEGKICISRNLKPRKMQKQNFNLMRINTATKALYAEIQPSFKKELAVYAKQYKIAYPRLRKRGMSSYAVLLMIVHALIHRFSIPTTSPEYLLSILRTLISSLTIMDAIQIKLLKRIKNAHQLNHKPMGQKLIPQITHLFYYQTNKKEQNVSLSRDYEYHPRNIIDEEMTYLL